MQKHIKRSSKSVLPPYVSRISSKGAGEWGLQVTLAVNTKEQKECIAVAVHRKSNRCCDDTLASAAHGILEHFG